MAPDPMSSRAICALAGGDYNAHTGNLDGRFGWRSFYAHNWVINKMPEYAICVEVTRH
jgi:hypothetical protein